ncbi:MAG: OmpA family protein [Pseudomonadota bacterium]
MPAVFAALLLVLAPARAADRDLDTQLVQPALTREAAFAVPGLWVGSPGQAHFGTALQYELAPLRTYIDGEPAGAALAWRGSLHLAAGLAASRRVDLTARIAALAQGSDGPVAATPASALAVSDLGLAARMKLLDRAHWGLGPELGLWVPMGTAESWVAEPSLRVAPALLGQVGAGRLRVLGRLGLTLRPEPAAGVDLDLRHELTAGLALGFSPREHLELLAELDSRHALASFLRAGGENPAAVLAGARACRPGLACLDLAAGTALSVGYGASALRLVVGVSPAPPAPERPEPLRVVQAPAPTAAVSVTPSQAPPPAVEERRAWVDHGRIVVGEPILFELGTAHLLPESLPVLGAVGEVLNAYPQIEHLVVEGHASEEGGTLYNYDLSLDRARAVYEALVEADVRPERLSYRGMGEVYPEAAGDRPAERRVDFLIAGLGPMGIDDGHPLLVPWTGEPLPAPVLGQARLGTDAHPILEVVHDAPAPEETTNPAFFEEEGGEEDEEESP